LTWFDRKGGRGGVIGEAADYSNPALSRDGHMLAVGKRDPVSRNRAIWIIDLVRGKSTPLTFDPADDFNPLWSPDGQKIIFVSNRKGHRDLYQKASSGAGLEEVLLESGEDKSCEDWTRDGKYVIYNQQTGNKPREIWAMPLFGDRKPFLVVSGTTMMREGHVSPNGKWISYTSSESGIPEIYVQNFPPTGGKWRVSIGGGIESSWNANGKELFYLQGTSLMAVDVDTESGSFDSKGTPRVLFDAPIANPLRNAYLTTADGQKFLINTRVETKDTLPMTLVLNWPAALKH
jgi:Tol biopolymer transport system component